MKTLIVYDEQNTKGKSDGDEFRLQAKAARAYYHDVVMVCLPAGTAMEKRLFLFRKLEAMNADTYDLVLFFCHGAPKSLNRKMITKVNVGKFAGHLNKVLTSNGSTVFFSCSTARLRNGFATWVAEATGRRVIGHTVSGHTTHNPYKVLVDSKWQPLWHDAPFHFIDRVLRRGSHDI